MISDCRSLAKFELKGIPPMVAGAAVIEVTFQVDADGIMEVQARELSTGVASSIVIKPSYGLEDKDIEQMIKDSYTSAEADKDVRALQESRVEAKRIIEALENALTKDGKQLLDKKEIELLDSGIIKLREVIAEEDAEVIRQGAKALNEASLVFAGRRMDTQIKSALKGHALEEYE